MEALARFIERRRGVGEQVDAETFRRNVPLGLIGALESFIDRFESYLGDDFRTHFDEWRSGAVDVEFLGTFGRVLERPYGDPPGFLNERRSELVELIVDALEGEPRRSVLLVGEPGVGKTALIRAALDRLPVHLAVADVDLMIEQGEFVALEGPSGSGKTTLLQLLGALDRPSSGRVHFEGRDLAALPDGELADLRLRSFGLRVPAVQPDPDSDRARERAGKARSDRDPR